MRAVNSIFCWLICLVAISYSQNVPFKNAELDSNTSAVHLAEADLEGWEVSGTSKRMLRVWESPGRMAIALSNKSQLHQLVYLKELYQNLPGDSKWRLVFAVDVIGNMGKSAALFAELIDAESGASLVSQEFPIASTAPRSTVANPKISATSFKSGSGNPDHVVDGNLDTIWHSNWGRENPGYPHELVFDLGTPHKVRGFKYVPRKDGGNGTVRKYEVWGSDDHSKWKPVHRGQFNFKTAGEHQKVKFERIVKYRFLKLKCISSWNGDKFASCAELDLDIENGFDWQPVKEEPPSIDRCFLPLTFEQTKSLEKVVLKFGAATRAGVVLDRTHLFFVPTQATNKMRGKPNGQSGPDFLGAGSFGFDGLMIHKYPALPIIRIHENSNALRAGLKKTDLIVGINDRFLPIGNVNPGFEWFENSHEALLGRAAVGSFSASSEQQGCVRLNVLRGNKLENVDIQLDLPSAIANENFLSNPETLELINDDLIRNLLSTQMRDGSWKRNPVHTCLGGLALLSLKDQKYAPQIKACANWLMSRNAEPGTGFYWHPAFAGIFLGEYYLATGDKRVLPFMERMLRMMSSAFHTSKWGTETFGHGPRGLPYGNKSLVAVMVHVILFETLAKRCGIDSKIYETLTPYLESAWSNPADGGHGALGYNKSYKDLAEFWSRSGILSLALHMRSTRKDMQKGMTEVMYTRHPWFRNSHAYGEPGGVLGLIALSQVRKEYYLDLISKYRWWFALAWRPGDKLHFTIPHMGAPYMEGPVLINNGYAVLFNAHRKSLHLTGGKKRNWLNVDNIEVPISDVMILKDKNRVILRSKIPGPEIYFTTDGSRPNVDSQRYSKPFKVNPGTMVRALAVNSSGRSKIAERKFGLDKKSWSIRSASGNVDSEKATLRARNAIDGDLFIPWVTDVGEGARGFPHEIVIDLGRNQSIGNVTISNLFQDASASKIRIQTAKSGKSPFGQSKEFEFEKYTAKTDLSLDSNDKCRLVKIVFEKSFSENKTPVLMVGEIDFN